MITSAPQRCEVHLDGIVEHREKLGDAGFLVSLLYEVAALVDMTILNMTVSDIAQDLEKLGRPAFEDEGGISVLALISTSHIAVHGWPNRSFFMFDLVSCRPFEAEPVIKLLKRKLGVVAENESGKKRDADQADNCIPHVPLDRPNYQDQRT